MAPNTIPPPRRDGVPADSKVDFGQRYIPAVKVEREIDQPRPSAFPEERRFSTIYPFSRASEEATDAALQAARDHDRSASAGFLDVLQGRKDDDANESGETD